MSITKKQKAQLSRLGAPCANCIRIVAAYDLDEGRLGGAQIVCEKNFGAQAIEPPIKCEDVRTPQRARQETVKKFAA